MRPALRGALGLMLLALTASLPGCVSYTYVDSQNVRHVIGFVSMAIKPAKDDGSDANAISLTSVGLYVRSHPEAGNGVVLGYSRESLLVLPNGSCVDVSLANLCHVAKNQAAVDLQSRSAQP